MNNIISDKDRLLEIFSEHRVDILSECISSESCKTCQHSGKTNCRILHFVDTLLNLGFTFKSQNSIPNDSRYDRAMLTELIDVQFPVMAECGMTVGVRKLPQDVRDEIVDRLMNDGVYINHHSFTIPKGRLIDLDKLVNDLQSRYIDTPPSDCDELSYRNGASYMYNNIIRIIHNQPIICLGVDLATQPVNTKEMLQANGSSDI